MHEPPTGFPSDDIDVEGHVSDRDATWLNPMGECRCHPSSTPFGGDELLGPPSCRLRRRRATIAVVAAASPSAVARDRGFFVAGCLSKDSGGATKGDDGAPAPGSRLKKTPLPPMPKGG